MSKASDSFENAFLKHLFQNLAIAGIGDAAGLLASAAAGNLYLRLCTSAVAVNDATIGTECAYTGYVAKGIAVVRSAVGWTVTNNQAVNAAELVFGACTAGAETIRYVEIWKNNTGATEADRIAWVQLSADFAVAAGMTPRFEAGAIVITFD
jgi:hypothetical protein